MAGMAENKLSDLGINNGALIQGDSGTISVVSSALDHLVINIQPSSSLSVDFPFDTAAVLTAYDVANNPISGATIVADRDPASGAGTLRGTLSVVTNTAGQAIFSNLAYNRTDAFKVRFTSNSKTVISNQVGPLAAGAATQVRVETAANGSGTVVPSQTLLAGSILTVYGVTRDQYSNFVANPASMTWSLISKTGGVADADLSATSGASVTLTGHLAGTAVIHAVNGALAQTDSGTISVVLPGGSSGGGGSVGGGFFGGGIAAPTPTPGITDIRQKANNSGVFYVDAYASSQDGKVMLKIDASTHGLNEDGMPLTEIGILPNPNLPAPPAAEQAMVLTL